MCGILGIINKRTEKKRAEIALETLRHRGPDAGLIWQEEDVTLGHRRLSILDLSEAGIQPMRDAEGRYLTVFNGEIYNFLELRSELIRKGYVFSTDTDTEVLLYSYIEWGADCLNRFNGMWAFAIWDREKRELFISRDRFGVKPLFYTWLDAGKTQLAFASEMKALMPLMEEHTPNRRILTRPGRMMSYESTDECLIREIYRFPAASCALFCPDAAVPELRIKKYYSVLDNLMKLPEDYGEQVEMFRSLFLDATSIRMRSDVTLGTALSGGLDSSATICTMSYLASGGKDARMGQDWQHAYVAAFPGTVMDERKYARMVTDYLGIESTEVVIDPAEAVTRLDDMLYLFEEVYLTSPIPMMELYSQLRKDGTIVTIDGHGADELFGGYTFDFINALADCGRDEESRREILDAYIASFPDDGSNAALKDRSHRGVMRMYKKRELKNRLAAMFMPGGKQKEPEGFSELDSLNRVLYRSSFETILPTLMRNYDRYSMANGVEIRMPFMDHRIVEFAFSIGFRSKLHGGYSKSVIRDALEPIMPKKVVRRRTKIGFNTPVVEWMKGPLKEYFTDVVSSADFSSCSLIKPEQVRRSVMHVINDPGATLAQGEAAWSMLSPYLWERAFLNRCRQM